VNHFRISRVLAAAFLLLAAVSADKPVVPKARDDQEVLARVDGIPITRFQWDRLAVPYFEEVKARAGRPLSKDEEQLLRKNVLDELVRERLWVADARRRGFTVSEAELDARLQRNDYFKTNGTFDPAKFRSYKLAPESNYHDIQDQVRNAVLLDKYVAWMRTKYRVTEPELRKEFQSRTSQAVIRYLWLTPDQVSLEPQSSASQIQAYYEGHKDAFQTPEEARISYIRIGVEHAPGASDSVHAAAEAQAVLGTKAVLAGLRAGQPAEKLANAIREVSVGRRVIDGELALAAWDTEECPLTSRELEVLRMTESGADAVDIAARLFLSAGTVRNYLTTIVTKLNARNRVDAIRIARDAGWM